ncbi:hypothetical protein [Kibdelosporangium aridum]|uniref:Uncharacterized protein n=1 Tax=Kibdelosporangium aridum TaxID=2030 RepID=A0A1Y5XIU5_KIBAR|nr:hypothetical protein [Kibdelosporangium aridum]SMC91519.1 hypothetical protein SAMN05661093_02763 [Kibdelosporangium aridum]
MTDEGSPTPIPPITYVVDPAPPPQEAPSRSRKTFALWTVAVVFLLATAGFVTLWVLERDDHKATVGQLGTARAELDGVKAKVAGLEKRHVDTEGRIKTANDERQKYEADAAAAKPCAEAGRELIATSSDGSDRAIAAAVRLIRARCE